MSTSQKSNKKWSKHTCAISLAIMIIPIKIGNYNVKLTNWQKLKSAIPSIAEDVELLEFLYTMVKV